MKRIVGFGAFEEDDSAVPEKPASLLELIEVATDEELLVIQDIVRERFECDDRMRKIPDLANSEFSVFDNRKVDKVSPKILEIRKRRYVSFVYFYSHLDRTDDQMIKFIQICNPELSYIEAARDLSNIKMVIGNLPRARKELIRLQVTEMLKKAYQKAEEKGDPTAMAIAANNISKANALDKEDLDIPWDQMIPSATEPTDDISVTGRIPTKDLDAKIEKMKKKYLSDAEDAEIVPEKKQ